MTEVIQHSDNVGMVFVGKRLGKDKMLEYYQKFGFGKGTGVDLQEETEAILRPKEKWYELDVMASTFGQGIAVTPLQMLRAVAAIANRGIILTPRVIDTIFGKKIASKSGTRIISQTSAAKITQMMINSVDRGEARWAKPPGFVIAGKTGTAQIPVSGHYDKTKTIASFIGFAPADDPKFAMLVTLREPKTSPWGSETAAPLWFNISREIFRHFGLVPN
jgi:cell division protein FtsI/penicillin-binding protein 2